MQADSMDWQIAELLTKTVTLHWLVQIFIDHRVVSIDDYIRGLLQSITGE